MTNYRECASALNDLAFEAYSTAVAHGWWNDKRSFPEQLCLIHSEVSEALEEYRDGHPITWRLQPGVIGMGGRVGPKGVPVELADIIIRVLDICGRYDINIGNVVLEKMAYNSDRPHRHGGKLA